MELFQFKTLCSALYEIGSVRHNNRGTSIAGSLYHAEHILFNAIDDALHTIEPEERREYYAAAIQGCSYGVLLDEDKETLSEWVESLKDLGA